MQLKFGREQLQNLREIYNLDLKLQWPTHRLAGESLGTLARGMGSKLDPSVFDTSEAPPELPTHSLGGPGGGEGGPFGDISGGYEVPEEGEGGPSKGWGSPGRIAGAFLGGVGGYLLGGKIGRGRREADYLVPHQEELTRRILQIESEVDSRIAAGTMTDDDWAAASNAVRSMKDRYFEFTQPYERAGPGGRQSIGGWVDPLLTSWGNKTARGADSRGGGAPPAQRQPAQIDQNPLGNPFGDPSGNPLEHRARGGPVRRGGRQTLSAMGKPMYWVGEKGPEKYVSESGQSSMVGMGGPEVRTFPEDGQIVPNHELGMGGYGGPGMQGPAKENTFTLSKMADGNFGMASGPRTPQPGRSGLAFRGQNPGRALAHWFGRGANQGNPLGRGEMHGIPGRHGGGEVEGEAHEYDHEDHRDVTQWGWEEGQDGQWTHPGDENNSSATGYWAADGTFVNETTNQVYDPEQYEVTEIEGDLPPRAGDEAIQPGEFLRRNPTRPPPVRTEGSAPRRTPDPFSFDIPGTRPGAPMGQAIDGRTPEGMLQAGGWTENANGTWIHTGGQVGYFLDNGTFLNKDSGKVWDPTTGNMSDIDAAGYMPLNQEFAFDDAGYQPFGTEFEFDDTGHQPFETKFEFDAEDLQDDPGYQWRLDQGNKGVERSAAASGMLQSGKTLKGLQRWSQGLASQEYRDAYGRARSEFDLGRDQTRGAYGRAWDEFGQRRDQTREAYGRDSNEYDRRYSQGLDAYGRAMQEWGLEYGTEADTYNRSWDQFLNRQNQWERDQGNRWNRTMTTALLGSGGGS